MTILIDKKDGKSFAQYRGIRQGDLLSPFLFRMAFDGFNIMINGDISSNILSSIGKVRDYSGTNCIQFIDNTIIFASMIVIKLGF